MEKLAKALELPLTDCFFIRLPGHAVGETFRNITASQWVDSFYEQYMAATQDNPRIVFIGFSLGGLLMTYLLGLSKIRTPQKQILLAPALAFQGWTWLPSILPSSLDNLLIPSFTPKGYKAGMGVTIGAYKILFQIRNELEHLPPHRYDIPTLILCDEHDELVAPQGLQKFIEQKKLTRWQLQICKSSLWKHMGRKHLIVAREYRPEDDWHHLKACMDDFLYE